VFKNVYKLPSHQSIKVHLLLKALRIDLLYPVMGWIENVDGCVPFVAYKGSSGAL